MGAHNSKKMYSLSQDDIEELKACTEFRGSEISRWYDQFKKDYPGGVISKAQFIQTYKNMYPDGKYTYCGIEIQN